jgi:16S rRNA (guanine527-N7)-methyltransferase
LIDDRFPTSRAPIPDKEKAKAGSEESKDNALWRMPEWYPDTPSQLMAQLKTYHSELLKFNVKLNLVARSTEREADEVHFADSLLAARLIPAAKMAHPLYDIGSGNGLPGVIVGLLNPNLETFLVESDSRKAEFLKHVIHVLQLKNVKVMNARLENIKTPTLAYGMSRGFASISKTILACNKIFLKGGRFFHLKSGAWSKEIAEIPSQLISIWTPELVGEYALPNSQVRRAVICTTKIS